MQLAHLSIKAEKGGLNSYPDSVQHSKPHHSMPLMLAEILCLDNLYLSRKIQKKVFVVLGCKFFLKNKKM